MSENISPSPNLKSLAQMKLKMLLFLAIVAANIFAITRINAYVVAQEQDLLRGINLSGRQRMLSQRIPMLTSVILREGVYADLIAKPEGVTSVALEDAIAELSHALSLMEESHLGLLNGSEKLGLPEAPREYTDFYFNKDPEKYPIDSTYVIHDHLDTHHNHHSHDDITALNDEVMNFINDGRMVRDTAIKITNGTFTDNDLKIIQDGYSHLYDHSYKHLLTRIDKSVFIYEEAGQASLNKIKVLEPILFGGSIFMLLIVWFSVFRPMETRIKENLYLLEGQKHDAEREKNRLNLALEGTSTGIWEWEMNSGNIHFSKVIISILGLSGHIDETQFNSSADVALFQSLLKPRESRRLSYALVRHIKHEEPFFFETQLQHENGQWIWVQIRGSVVEDNQSGLKRMLGSVEDITSMKAAEREKTIFTYGIESANIPFAIIDLSSKSRQFIYASPAFCNLTGYSNDKILSGNINIFTGPETSMNILDQIDYAFSTNNPLTLKVVHYKSDGTAFWNEISLEPILFKDEEKGERYFSVIFNDLTDTIAKEKQEVARQRTESLGSLAGSVAHEINNLLMPMTMAKDMLEDSLKEDCDPFAIEQLDVMVDYANQAKNIVQGILTFSRKETKNMEKANIYEELESAVQFIQNLMSTKTTLKLAPVEHETDKYVEALINTTEIKQIITNLCRNAEDSFDDGDGEINISFRQEKLSQEQRDDLDVISNDFCVISVQDNGSGIEPEHLDSIFDPLFTTKDVGQGTGLGLSVVVGILRSWGGAIKVKSILGKGTTFDIFIPIHKNENNFDHLADLSDEFFDEDFENLHN